MTVTPPAAPPNPAPRVTRARVRRAVPLAVLAAAAVAATGCGSDEQSTTNAAATNTGSVPRAALADDVPARAAAFVEASLKPGGDSQEAIEQLVALVGGAGRSGAAGKLRLGDDLLPKGRTFRKDILPHLGDHAAAFLMGGAPAKDGARTTAKSVDGAIVAEVRDAAKLREAVGTAGKAVTVGGQTIRVTDDHAVWIGDRIAAVGSEPAVRAAIAAAGGADLAGDDRFTAALEQVRATSPIGISYVDLQQAPALNAAFADLATHARALGARGKDSKAGASALRSLPKGLRDRVEERLGSKGSSSTKRGFSLTLPASDATAAMALELTPGKLVVRSGGTDATPSADPKAGSDAVAALPAGSWAAFGGGASGALAKGSPGAMAFDRLTSMLGTTVPSGLRDALAGVESVSGGVQGQNLLAASGGVVLRAKDDAGATALLKQLGEVLGGKGGAGGLAAKPTTIPGASDGLTVGLPGLPLQIAAGVQGDRLAVGLGVDSVTKALATDKRFADDPLYAKAQGLLDGAAPSFVLQPKPLTDLLASLGDGLGGLLGGGSGSGGGLGGLLGGGAGGAKGSGSSRDSGPMALLGSGGFAKVVDAGRRVKLVTAGREATGATTWRGSLVVEYDATAPKAAKP